MVAPPHLYIVFFVPSADPALPYASESNERLSSSSVNGLSMASLVYECDRSIHSLIS